MSRPLQLTALSLLLLYEQGTPAFAQEPGSWLGDNRGSFPTGTIEEVWIDSDREETRSATPRDLRHLTVQIWYPAESNATESRAPYAANIDDYEQAVRETWGPAASRLTRSYVGAPLSDERLTYPVILYSHGFGNPSFTGTFQTEFLASHGYVVVSIGHTGWDGRIQFPDGYRFETVEQESETEPEQTENLPPIDLYRLAGEDESLKALFMDGLQDIAFVIDELERQQDDAQSRFYQRLDLSSLGGVGFSTGGSTYIQATNEDPRLDVAVNMDGGLNGLPVLAEGASRPILLIQASNNYPTVSNGPTDAGMEEFFVEVEREIWQMLRLSSHDWAKGTIAGTIHPHFSDAFLVAPTPPELANPEDVHDLANRLVLEFFDRHLKGNEDAPLLEHRVTMDGLNLVTKQQAE